MTRTRIGMLMLAVVVLGLGGLPGGAAPRAREQAAGRRRGQGRGAVEPCRRRARDGRKAHGRRRRVGARGGKELSRRRCSPTNEASTLFPPLDGGRYDVWAQAVGYETARAQVAVEATRPAHQAFTLNTIKDVTPQLSPSEWFAALPEDTREQRRMKAIFRTNCTACHGITHALQNRFDENGWRAMIGLMERLTGTGGINRHTTVAHYKDELAKYLASVRGPASADVEVQARPASDRRGRARGDDRVRHSSGRCAHGAGMERRQRLVARMADGIDGRPLDSRHRP